MLVYDLQALGCKLDGNPASAAANTAIILKAEQDARGGNPGPLYLGMGGPMPILNGKLVLNAPSMVLRGEGGMGTVPDWGGPTSTIMGIGPGDTLRIPQGGCKVNGLAWKSDGQQSGADAYIKILGTHVGVSDLHMDSPNIGVSIQRTGSGFVGQSWVRNLLIEGYFKQAGIDLNNGGGATLLDHVRMFNGVMKQEDPQPPYGILVKSAGELMISNCDIDNCGVNLAIVPGIDGQANSMVQNLDIVNCDFDNGNGEAQILLRPYGSSFILNVQIGEGWTSTAQKASSTWQGNGITIDGTRAHTAMGFPCISNVGIVNTVTQYAVGHAGIYANKAHGLSVVRSTSAGNFTGYQFQDCIGLVTAVCAGNYLPPYVGQPTPGNTGVGVWIRGGNMKFNPADCCLDGNGHGPYDVH